MEGNTTEITPTGEGQQLTKPVVKPQPEQTTEQKSGLASRLTEIKASAHAHAQKATQLFGVRVSETEVQKSKEKITPKLLVANSKPWPKRRVFLQLNLFPEADRFCKLQLS